MPDEGTESIPIRTVTVAGTGAWGTALSILLSRCGAETTLLARTDAEAAELATRRENRRFLPGVALPESLMISADPARAVASAELLVLAAPAQQTRANVQQLVRWLQPRTIVLCASKGIELQTGLRMSEVITEAGGDRIRDPLTLSGPNLSGEIVAGLPAATVVAGPPGAGASAVRVQALISSNKLRVYTSDDQPGVELGGALKNVIAIACGICDGLGYGHNARAGLITRGLAEMTRLAMAAGGYERTLAGLAGLGDLMTTVASEASRNYSLGVALGKGIPLGEAISAGGHIAEGAATTTAALMLAARLNIELPITAQVEAVVNGHAAPADAAHALMLRALGQE